MITVNHSACMLFGGSFEPAYLLTISAISEQIKPVTNRRNAALIQRFLGEELTVSSERGIIKFQAIAEENLANCGITLAAGLQQDNKPSTVPAAAPTLSGTFSLSRRLNSNKKRYSTRSSQSKSNLPTPPGTPPYEAGQPLLTVQPIHNRNVSDVTMSSSPDIDPQPLQYNKAFNDDLKTPKPLEGKKSRFFRKLIA